MRQSFEKPENLSENHFFFLKIQISLAPKNFLKIKACNEIQANMKFIVAVTYIAALNIEHDFFQSSCVKIKTATAVIQPKNMRLSSNNRIRYINVSEHIRNMMIHISR